MVSASRKIRSSRQWISAASFQQAVLAEGEGVGKALSVDPPVPCLCVAAICKGGFRVGRAFDILFPKQGERKSCFGVSSADGPASWNGLYVQEPAAGRLAKASDFCLAK